MAKRWINTRAVFEWVDGKLVENKAENEGYHYDGPVARAMDVAVVTLDAFRWRTDTGGVNDTPTWGAPQNCSYVIDVSGGNAEVRLRIGLQESGNAAEGSAVWELRYGNFDAESETVISGSSSKVQMTTTASSGSDGDAITTSRLTGLTGTFEGHELVEAQPPASVGIGANNHLEIEYCLKIIAADVTDNEVILISPWRGTSTTRLDGYPRYPALIIRKSAETEGSQVGYITRQVQRPTTTTGESFQIGTLEDVKKDDLLIFRDIDNNSDSYWAAPTDSDGNTWTELDNTGYGGGASAYSSGIYYTIAKADVSNLVITANEATGKNLVYDTCTVNQFRGVFNSTPIFSGTVTADADSTSPYIGEATGTLSAQPALVVGMAHARGAGELDLGGVHNGSNTDSFQMASNEKSIGNGINQSILIKRVTATTSIRPEWSTTSAQSVNMLTMAWEIIEPGTVKPNLFTNENTFYAHSSDYDAGQGGLKRVASTTISPAGTGITLTPSATWLAQPGDIIIVTWGVTFTPSTGPTLADNAGRTWTKVTTNTADNPFTHCWYRLVEEKDELYSSFEITHSAQGTAPSGLLAVWFQGPFDPGNLVTSGTRTFTTGLTGSATVTPSQTDTTVYAEVTSSASFADASNTNSFIEITEGEVDPAGDYSEAVQLPHYKIPNSTSLQTLDLDKTPAGTGGLNMRLHAFNWLVDTDVFPYVFTNENTFYGPDVTYDDDAGNVLATWTASAISWPGSEVLVTDDQGGNVFLREGDIICVWLAHAGTEDPAFDITDDGGLGHDINDYTVIYRDQGGTTQYLHAYYRRITTDEEISQVGVTEGSSGNDYVIIVTFLRGVFDPTVPQDIDVVSASATGTVSGTSTTGTLNYPNEAMLGFYAVGTAMDETATTANSGWGDYIAADRSGAPGAANTQGGMAWHRVVTATTSVDFTVTRGADGGNSYTSVITFQIGQQTLTPSLFDDSADTFYSATAAAGAITLTPAILDDSTDTFNAHTVSATYSLTASLLAGVNTIYVHTVDATYTLTAALYDDSTDTFYSPNVQPAVFNQELTPSLYDDSTDTFNAHTVTSAITLDASLYNDADTFPTHVLSGQYDMTAALFADGDTIFSHTVSATYSLVVPLVSDADTFYTHAVTSVATIAPNLYADADVVYAHTAASTYSLIAPLFLDPADTFYTHTVAAGTVTLVPSLYTDADTFNLHTLDFGSNLTAGLYTDDDTIFAHSVAATYALTAPLLDDSADTFNTHTLAATYDLSPALYPNAESFFTPIIVGATYSLIAPLFTDGDTFNTHTLDRGAVNLTVALYDDSVDTFNQHLIDSGFVLEPVRYDDPDTFEAHAVTYSNTLVPALYANASLINAHTVDATYALTVDQYTNTSTIFAHTAQATYSLTAPLLDDSADTIFAHTLSLPPYELTPALYSDADTFNEHVVGAGFQLIVGLYTDADAFPAHSVSATYTLTVDLYSDPDTFEAHAIGAGFQMIVDLYADADTIYAHSALATYDLTAPLIDDSTDTFYGVTASLEVYPLSPALLSDADVFPTHALTGAVAMLPALYADPDVFHTPVLAEATYSLIVDLYADADTFFTPILAEATYVMTAALVGSESVIYAHTSLSTYDLVAPALASTEAFYTPVVVDATYSLTVGLYSDDDTFNLHLLETSGVAAPPLYVDPDAFYSHTLSGTYALLTALYADDDTVYAHAVVKEAYELTPALLDDSTDTYYTHVVTRTQSLVAEQYEDADTFYTFTLTYDQFLEVPYLPSGAVIYAVRAYIPYGNVVIALYEDRVVTPLQEQRIAYTEDDQRSVEPIDV